MKVYRTTDVNVVDDVLFALRDVVLEDGVEHSRSSVYDAMDRGAFFLVENFGEVLGVIYYHAVGPGVLEVHINMLPEGRGDIALRAFSESLSHLGGVKKIVASIPEAYPNVERFAQKAGLTCLGQKGDEVWKKRGKEYKVNLYEKAL